MTALLSELPLEDEPIAMVQSDGVPVPRVNLLPPELLERRALSRLGRGLGAAVLATVLIGAGVGYLGGNGRVTRLKEASTALPRRTSASRSR